MKKESGYYNVDIKTVSQPSICQSPDVLGLNFGNCGNTSRRDYSESIALE